MCAKKAATNKIPFRYSRELTNELNQFHAILTTLNSGAENLDANAAGRGTALLYLEVIKDLLRFKSRFDMNIGDNIFMRDFRYAVKDNFRQEMRMLSVYSRLMSMIMKAGDGLIKCVGGDEAIGVHVLGIWAAAGNPTGNPDPGRLQILESITAFVQARNVERRQCKKG